MALKIRLKQMGRTNRLTYRLVVADSRSKRDGKYLEMVGHYDPHVEGNDDVSVVEDRIEYWLERGAELTEKSKSLLMRAAPGLMKAQREKKLENKKKAPAKKKEKK